MVAAATVMEPGSVGMQRCSGFGIRPQKSFAVEIKKTAAGWDHGSARPNFLAHHEIEMVPLLRLEDADEERQRLLGPERAQLYEQLQNPAFAEIHNFARGQGLGDESANQAYRLHETLVSSVEALVDQTTELSKSDAGAIAEVRAEILGQLSEILGEDGLAAYESRVLPKDSQLVE